MSPRTKSILTIIGAVLFLAAVVVFVLWQLGKPKSYDYEVVVFPSDSTLTIDGQPAQPGQISLVEGSHTLKATRQYFDDATLVVDTNTLQPGQQIFVLPQATSPEALQWLDDHPEELGGIGEMMSATQVEQDNQTINDRYPIVNKLPYNSIDYKVDFQIAENFDIAFTITLYPYAKPGDTASRERQLKQFKAASLKFLTDNGIDTSKVPVTFIPAEAANL